MTPSRARHARLRGLPPFVKVGAIALLPVLGVGGLIYAVTGDDPVTHARVESTAPDSERDGETPAPDATTPSADDTGSATPTGTPSPTDDESGGSDDSGDSGSGTGGSGGSGSGAEDDGTPDADEPSRQPVVTVPPNRPTPTDEPTPTPTGEAEPTEEPTGEPTPSPTDETEPTDEPTPFEPDHEPTEPTQPLLPELPLSGAEAAMVESVAEVRAEAGCPDLRVDPRLQTAARVHSADMRERHFVSNVNPDGEGPQHRAAAEGFAGSVGENVGFGRQAHRVVDTWSDGDGERARLLDCDYTAIGVGAEPGLLGSWWTLMLGRD